MTRLENVTKYMMALLTALIVSTLYAPIVMTIFFSFYKTRKGLVNWESFSYEPYTKLIFEKQILESLLNSLYVGSITVVCSVVIGFYFANYYHTSRGKMKELLQFIIFLPFLLPPIITGLSLLIFFREIGLPRSECIKLISFVLDDMSRALLEDGILKVPSLGTFKVRKKITKFITLKFLPKINFKIDSSFDKFRQIDDILKRPEVVKDLQINSNKN